LNFPVHANSLLYPSIFMSYNEDEC
jgi:hypothetical protein